MILKTTLMFVHWRTDRKNASLCWKFIEDLDLIAQGQVAVVTMSQRKSNNHSVHTWGDVEQNHNERLWKPWGGEPWFRHHEGRTALCLCLLLTLITAAAQTALLKSFRLLTYKAACVEASACQSVKALSLTMQLASGFGLLNRSDASFQVFRAFFNPLTLFVFCILAQNKPPKNLVYGAALPAGRPES